MVFFSFRHIFLVFGIYLVFVAKDGIVIGKKRLEEKIFKFFFR